MSDPGIIQNRQLFKIGTTLRKHGISVDRETELTLGYPVSSPPDNSPLDNSPLTQFPPRSIAPWSIPPQDNSPLGQLPPRIIAPWTVAPHAFFPPRTIPPLNPSFFVQTRNRNNIVCMLKICTLTKEVSTTYHVLQSKLYLLMVHSFQVDYIVGTR